jgi:hypothetical protein
LKLKMRQSSKNAAFCQKVIAKSKSLMNLPPNFVPCDHEGPCLPSNRDCRCAGNISFCEKFCACPGTCANRYVARSYTSLILFTGFRVVSVVDVDVTPVHAHATLQAVNAIRISAKSVKQVRLPPKLLREVVIASILIYNSITRSMCCWVGRRYMVGVHL